VRRRVKDSIEISEYTPLDALIERLEAFRESLPEGSSPELVIRGDDFFGHRLTITYLRELTEEEAALEKRYLATGARNRSRRSARPSRAMGSTAGRQGAQVPRTLG
jgi:hypothetical protein